MIKPHYVVGTELFSEQFFCKLLFFSFCKLQCALIEEVVVSAQTDVDIAVDAIWKVPASASASANDDDAADEDAAEAKWLQLLSPCSWLVFMQFPFLNTL